MLRNPIVCFPVYSPAVFPKAVECILSLFAGSLQPGKIVVVDNSGGDFAIYYRGKDTPNNLPVIEIVTFQRGIGLTGTWNYAFERFKDEPYLVLPGDDCVFHEHTLRDMVTELETNQDAMIVYPGKVTDPPDKSMSPWSFFAQRRSLYEIVGEYQTLYPIYYSDNDYAYRMKLAGIDVDKVIVAVNTTAGHYGSYTVKTATGEIKRNHDRYWYFTSELYPAMWGGTPGKEYFTSMFNGKDANTIIKNLKGKYNIDA